MPVHCEIPAREAATAVATADVVRGTNQSKARRAGALGFLLADLNFKSVYVNQAAAEILSYPQRPQTSDGGSAFVQQRIRSIFQVDRFATQLPAASFLSGRRRYICRPLLLESSDRPPMLALLLERHRRDPLDLADLNRRFRLSPRECETVQHLVRGLSTKEIAERMSVSPNTVKQFVRLILTKMGVTTRLGIIGKLVSGESARS